MRTSALALGLVLIGCSGSTGTSGGATRSMTIRMQGPSCKMACSAQLHPGEVVTDCTPPLDFEPTKRDPSMTVCFFGPAPVPPAPAVAR
jgi:hypothetical protein